MYIIPRETELISKQLETKYVIGFKYVIQRSDLEECNIVRAYLLYGNGQEIRFYPEMLTDFMPRLFVKPRDISMAEYRNKLYSHSFKHGLSVSLKDGTFEDYYKMFTQTTHISVNLNRRLLRHELNEEPPMFCFNEYLNHEMMTQNMNANDVKSVNKWFNDNEYDTDSIFEDINFEISMDAHYESNIKQFLVKKHKYDEFIMIKNTVTSFDAPSETQKHQTCGYLNHVFDVKHCHFIARIIKILTGFNQKNAFKMDQTTINISDLMAAYDHIVAVHGLLKDINDPNNVQQYIASVVGFCEVKNCPILKQHISRTRERIDDETKQQTDDGEHGLNEVVTATVYALHSYLLHKEQELYRLKREYVNELKIDDKQLLKRHHVISHKLELVDREVFNYLQFSAKKNYEEKERDENIFRECQYKIIAKMTDNQRLQPHTICFKHPFCIHKIEVVANTEYDIYIKNEALFGINDYIYSQTTQLSFAPVTNVFYDRLRILEDVVVSIENCDDIDAEYCRQITDCKYMLVWNDIYDSVAKIISNKNMHNNGFIYTFQRLQDFKMWIPLKCGFMFNFLSLYVMFSGNAEFVLLKTFHHASNQMNAAEYLLNAVISKPTNINIDKNVFQQLNIIWKDEFIPIINKMIMTISKSTKKKNILRVFIKDLCIDDFCILFNILNMIHCRFLNYLVFECNASKHQALEDCEFKLENEESKPIHFFHEKVMFVDKAAIIYDKEYDLFIKSKFLFGSDDYIFFSFITTTWPKEDDPFYDELQIYNDVAVIIRNIDRIDQKYRCKIVDCEYMIVWNDNEHSESKRMNTKDLSDNTFIYKFDKIIDIKFFIPRNQNREENVLCLYFRFPECEYFLLLKRFVVENKALMQPIDYLWHSVSLELEITFGNDFFKQIDIDWCADFVSVIWSRIMQEAPEKRKSILNRLIHGLNLNEFSILFAKHFIYTTSCIKFTIYATGIKDGSETSAFTRCEYVMMDTKGEGDTFCWNYGEYVSLNKYDVGVSKAYDVFIKNEAIFGVDEHLYFNTINVFGNKTDYLYHGLEIVDNVAINIRNINDIYIDMEDCQYVLIWSKEPVPQRITMCSERNCSANIYTFNQIQDFQMLIPFIDIDKIEYEIHKLSLYEMLPENSYFKHVKTFEEIKPPKMNRIDYLFQALNLRGNDINFALNFWQQINIPWDDHYVPFINAKLITMITQTPQQIQSILKHLICDLNIDAFITLLNILQTVFVAIHPSLNYYILNGFNTDSCDIEDYRESVNNTKLKFVGTTNAEQIDYGSFYYFGKSDDISRPTSSTPKLCNELITHNICTVASFDSHNLCIDDDGVVFCWGYGADGALGIGHLHDIDVPRVLQMPIALKALEVAVGSTHSLILTEDGNLWSFGSSEYGQLGHGDTKSVVRPKRIENVAEYPIVQISCGAYHNCAISDEGKAFTWGKNDRSQCGLGVSGLPCILTPIHVLLMFEDKHLFAKRSGCGFNHTLLIVASGLVLSWGDGLSDDHPVLGHGPRKQQASPKVIDILSTTCITDIACGYNHCLCVDEFGTLYSWGHNGYGQLGHEHQLTVNEPSIVMFFVDQHINIMSCAAGSTHSAVISSNGELFMFGSNHYGQCGAKRKQSLHTPERVGFFQDISIAKVSLGYKYTTVITGSLAGIENQFGGNNIFVLKCNEEKNLYVDGASSSYNIFIQNSLLFGHDHWMFMQRANISESLLSIIVVSGYIREYYKVVEIKDIPFMDSLIAICSSYLGSF